MKKIVLWILLFLSLFSWINASWDDIFQVKTTPVIYCDNWDCSLEKWTEIVKNWIEWIEKNRTLSQYIMDVVKYLLTFISLVAVLYILYAWFKVLTWWWDEEHNKKAKVTIVSVLVWIVIIRLAYWIVAWLIEVITLSNVTP